MGKLWTLFGAACLFLSGCALSDPFKQVEEWRFTRHSYYIKSTKTPGQFDSFINRFLNESEVNTISKNLYSEQDGEDNNLDWYGVVAWMYEYGDFPTEVINELKAELAAHEQAVYFYETYINGDGQQRKYHWVRFRKN